MDSLPSESALRLGSSLSLDRTQTMSIKLMLPCLYKPPFILKSESENQNPLILSEKSIYPQIEILRTIYILELYLMLSQTEFKKEAQGANSKKSILFANSSLTYIELGELQKNISELVHQNRDKYHRISEIKTDFRYQLYKIGEFQANSKAFGKELLMRQLDRLLEQKNYLDRELSLIRFEDEEENIQKEQMVSDETNHFQLLKSIWHKDGNRRYEGVLEHIEQLNLMVGQIKCNISSLIKYESNDKKEFQDTYLNTFQMLRQTSQECSKCLQKQARIDYIQRKQEALEDKLAKITEENIHYLEEINKKDDKIKKLHKSQIKSQTELKDKLLRLEQEILKKDQNIKQLKKQMNQLNDNKFYNMEEGFQVIIKGTKLDLGKYQKTISLTCEELMSTIGQEYHKELRVNQNASKRISSRSQAQTTEDSNKSQKEQEELEVPVIRISYPHEGQRRSSENMDKRRLVDKGDGKHKTEENDLSNKRYVRTSCKRGQISVFHMDENDDGTSSAMPRGGSPIEELLIE